MSAREVFTAELKKLVPKAWQVAGTGRSVDLTKKTVVRVRQTTIRPFEQAPDGLRAIDLKVTIRVPEQATEAAEDRLDEEVTDLIHALDSMNVLWNECEKVYLDNTQTIGYDITVTIATTKE